MFNRLSVLRFEKASVEWLRFVSANRRGEELDGSYDVVMGSVANDRTMPVIRLYFSGYYDEEEALRRLLPQKLRDQYAFKTESALSALQVSEVIENG